MGSYTIWAYISLMSTHPYTEQVWLIGAMDSIFVKARVSMDRSTHTRSAGLMGSKIHAEAGIGGLKTRADSPGIG